MCVVQETSEPTLMCLVSLQLLAQWYPAGKENIYLFPNGQHYFYN